MIPRCSATVTALVRRRRKPTCAATNSPVVAQGTFQDGTVVDEKADSVTTSGDARTVFFITKPTGLPTGRYTLHVLVDGREVRSKDVTVK